MMMMRSAPLTLFVVGVGIVPTRPTLYQWSMVKGQWSMVDGRWSMMEFIVATIRRNEYIVATAAVLPVAGRGSTLLGDSGSDCPKLFSCVETNAILHLPLKAAAQQY
jgi:hypothetical protein